MAVHSLDLKGLKCPGPTLRLTGMWVEFGKGDELEVLADCPTFEHDVKAWCTRTKTVLIWIRDEGNGVKKCKIQL